MANIGALAPSPVSVLDATLVHIGVREVKREEVPTDYREMGAPYYKLEIFPKRRGDTVTFYSDTPSARRPEKPREVVWIGHGLMPGMTITIEPKLNTDKQLLKRALYTIEADGQMVSSGHVWLPPKPDGTSRKPDEGERWVYSIKLLDEKRGQLADLDPDVIIQPDP